MATTNGINQRLAEQIESASVLIQIMDKHAVPYTTAQSMMLLEKESTMQTLLMVYGFNTKDAIETTGNLRSYATTEKHTEAKQTIKEIVAHLRGETYTPAETYEMIKKLRKVTA